MGKKGKIHIGTSGWHYKHWAGTFYPEDIKDTEQLEHYLKDFRTVELNNSFYKLPAGKTFKKWKDAVPKDFLFAVKGNRYITHLKKLKVEAESIDKFFNAVKKLEEKLGPILFQLPPNWKINHDRLEKFTSNLPPGYRYAFEFRNETWYDEKIYGILKTHNCAFCIYELGGHQSPELVTADFVYVRLHGPEDKYQGSYSDDALEEWAEKCKGWQKEGKDVYIYFDNDQKGYAGFNAKKLKELTGE